MRRVRLTEGQLHNVIRESVSQILNELDWKTYDNAAKKRCQRIKDRDELDRKFWPLNDAAIEAEYRKYPHLNSAEHKILGNTHEPLTPEEQEEYDAHDKEWDNQMNGRYKYEKGGRGYYLDDEE
jgi:hypothetical protein